jgi:hypothetical protein
MKALFLILEARAHRDRKRARNSYRFLVGSDSTRTCNQTVMSGGILIGFVDLAAFSFPFDSVCCGSMRSFLVRNWCGQESSSFCAAAAQRFGCSRNERLWNGSVRQLAIDCEHKPYDLAFVPRGMEDCLGEKEPVL